jgi:FMN-dependent NADH-azoreductase
LETYLRGILGFIGVKDPEFIIAEGLLLSPQQREKSIQNALQAASALHAA